jgi:hypothetical protein
MKTLIIHLVVLASVGLSNSPQAVSATVKVSISQVAQKVKEQDLLVLQNAERVYQSKEAIQVARMNLLPRLNLWKIVGIVVDWKNAVGLIEDLVPFLVPGNWFRAKEQRYFSEAESEGLKALQANEILTAKGIFYQITMDQELLVKVKEQTSLSREIFEFTKVQEKFGEVPTGTSAFIELRYLALLEDQRSLENLVFEEQKNFGYMIGIDPKDEVVLDILPMQTALSPISYDSVVQAVMDRSPEIKQFEYILAAAPYVKREVYFSFLGISSLSRGVMGGVFDQYPVQPGLGFGLGASVRIVRSQTQQLDLQMQAATEVLKKQLSLVVKNRNSDIENVDNTTKRLKLARSYMLSLSDRLKLGERVSALELIEGSKTQIESEANYLNMISRMRLHEDRLNRLLHVNEYDIE